MRSLIAGSFAAVCLSAFAAAAGVPNVSKVTPVTPGQGQASCPAGTTLKIDPRSRKAACVATSSPGIPKVTPGKIPTPPKGRPSKGRAVAPPGNKNCPKMPPGSKVSVKC